jgi:TonB family protein
MITTVKTLLALWLATTSVAVSAAPPRLPSGKWVVNFTDRQCVATRVYPSAGKPLYLLLKAPPLGEVMQIAIMQEAHGRGAEQVDAIVQVDDRPELQTSALAIKPKGSKLRTHLINLSLADFEPMRRAGRVSIRTPGLNETFALTALTPVLAGIERCLATLKSTWNVSSDGRESHLSKPATADVRGVFTSADYPSSAIHANKSGTSHLAILVDETGKVADCMVVQTSGAASLDAKSCALVTERARFGPALNLSGQPVRASLLQRVSWRVE